ncbi:MAG: hypothetical protein AVDCRST_MAG11-613, partial [uncultured Gemmatimonadaceae bacterium]
VAEAVHRRAGEPDAPARAPHRRGHRGRLPALVRPHRRVRDREHQQPPRGPRPPRRGAGARGAGPGRRDRGLRAGARAARRAVHEPRHRARGLPRGARRPPGGPVLAPGGARSAVLARDRRRGRRPAPPAGPRRL